MSILGPDQKYSDCNRGGASPRGSANADMATKNIETLNELLEKSKRNDAARAELHASIEAKKKAKDAAYELSKRDALVDELGAAYLEVPGATEQGFDAALPGLLKRKAESAALDGDARLERQIAAAKATGKYSI